MLLLFQLIREAWRRYNRCQCGQVDGGPYGYREHWCTHGCPDHGPCKSGVCVHAAVA